MNSKPQVIISPRQIELNEVITIRSANENEFFHDMDYRIFDESGRIVRKGAITRGINEFKLCIVGFKTGVYKLSMGQALEHFTVL